MDRDDGNYEGKSEDNYYYNNEGRQEAPFRWNLAKKYKRAT